MKSLYATNGPARRRLARPCPPKRYFSITKLGQVPEAALPWLAGVLGPAERRALREIAQAGDLAEVAGKTYLVAPVSPATIDAMAAFEPAPNAEQSRATCGRALLLLAKKMLRDGASVIAIAAQVELDPDNARKQLRMYSRDAKRTSAAEVARIAAPILATGKAETKRRKGRRASTGPASEPETENVIPIAFKGAGLTIPK